MRALVKGVFALVAAAILLAGPAGLMGCNTVEGVGKDAQKVGEKVEDAADRNK